MKRSSDNSAAYRKRQALLIMACTIAGLCACIILPKVSWSMGTPPFDADVRSAFSAATQQLIETKGCLSREDTIVASSQYRRLKSRTPITGKEITATLSFPARDAKGGRLIPVWFAQTTNAEGVADFVISLGQALADAEKTVREDRGYRGVKRVRGRINLSFTSEDTLKQSIRYVPARGIYFRLCRAGASGT
jgi:hypothetical protein